MESSVEIRRIGRLLLDVGLSGLSLFLAMHLRAGWPSLLEDRYALSVKLLIFSGVSAAVYLVTGLSLRSWRFVSMLDMFVMLRDIITAVVIFMILNFLIARLISIPLSVPISVPIIACFIMITTLGGVRVLYRSFVDGGLPFGFKNFLHADLRQAEPIRLLAYGANTETDAILRSLQSETAHSYQVVGIIDDDPASRDRCIRGIKVLGCSADLGRIAEGFAQSSIKLASLILPANSLSRQKLREIVGAAAAAGLRAVRVPPTCDLLQNVDAAFSFEPIEITDPDKVLVIGGAGYIGSILVEKLLHLGLKVSVLDAMHYGEQALSRVAGHPALNVIREDFRHIEVVTRAMNGVGSVIHLGGLVGDPACAADPGLTIDINVTGTKLIAEIAKARGVRRFIFASSCSVYGARDEIVNELAYFNPQSLYAQSKVASEAVLSSLNSSEFAVTCLRFATIYGISGRPRFDLVVNLLCAKAVRDGVITVFGSDQWRPFVHVEDVARGIIMALQAPVGLVANEVFNVGSDGQNRTLGEVADLIQSQVPEARIVSDANCPDKRNYRVTFRKIHAQLGFEPAWTLERGIAQVVASVRSNEIGHYSLSSYSNVLHLKERGTKSFSHFNITGWENELMNIDHIPPATR
ncbi:MAG: NAD-dependent epimerase/dehydratase family protein [Gammaproteobacteria bacterium]